MPQNQPLLDFLHGLLGDGAARARFSADPAAALAAAGVVVAGPTDVHDALVRIGDDQDLAQGFDRGSDEGRGRATDVLHVPPPPPPEYFGEHDGHAAAVRYLDNYVTSNFDDLGPFTGSSAERGAGEDDYSGTDSVHDYSGTDGVHDYSPTDGVHDYTGHDYTGPGHDYGYGGQAGPGSEPDHHAGFDAGGL
jgi:hypothetical protein